MSNFIIGMLNVIIKAIGTVISFLTGLLPTSPFQAIDNSSVGEFLNGLAWIIPIPQIISILQAWVLAVGLYYVVQIALRWAKAIE